MAKIDPRRVGGNGIVGQGAPTARDVAVAKEMQKQNVSGRPASSTVGGVDDGRTTPHVESPGRRDGGKPKG